MGAEQVTGNDTAQSSVAELTVEVNGQHFEVVVEDSPQATGGSGDTAGRAGNNASGGGTSNVAVAGAITADMQGTILSIAAEEGDEVSEGDVVCVLEAMKMETEVVASTSGIVESVPIAEGDSVDMGDTLVTLE